MLKPHRFVHVGIALLAAATVLLTGCGAKPSAGKAPAGSTAPSAAPSSPSTSTGSQPTADNQAASIKAGASAMRAQLVDLKKALEAGDAAGAQAGAEELEEAWEKFEDGVKAQDKALYGRIEDPLQAIEAGVKVSPLDVKTLGEQVQKLDGLLSGLAK